MGEQALIITLGMSIFFASPFAGIFIAYKLGSKEFGMIGGAVIGLLVGYLSSNILVILLSASL